MKIGITSDTHGSVTAWDKLMNGIFQDVNLILHCGDVLYHGPRNPLPEGYQPAELAQRINDCNIPIVFSRGNCDADVDQLLIDRPLQTPYAHIYAEGISIIVHHGHIMEGEQSVGQVVRMKTNIFVSGHIHVPVIARAGGILFLNPGSPSLSKYDGGIPTAAVISEGYARIFDIDSETIILEDRVL